jgi:tetratricopeptide (TPR) repeat protein
MRLLNWLGQILLAILGLAGGIAEAGPNAKSINPKPSKNANDPEEILRIANKYHSSGKFNQASDLLEKYKFSDKQESYRLFHLARALARQNRLEESIKKNEEALEINPALIAAKFNNICYAALLRDFNRADAYLSDLINTIAFNPHSKTLAVKYFAMAQTDKDLTEFRKKSVFKMRMNDLDHISRQAMPPESTRNVTGSPQHPMHDERYCDACGMG